MYWLARIQEQKREASSFCADVVTICFGGEAEFEQSTCVEEGVIMINKANPSLYARSIERKNRGEELRTRYGKRWDEYRDLWDAPLKNGKDAISFPLSYEVQLVDSCNLKCGICHSRKRTGEKLSKEDIDKIFSEGEKNGLCAVTFGMDSESLIDFDLLVYAMRSAASHKVMDILVGTNGILLTEERAAELCKYATMIKISVDAASAEMYNKIRHSDKYDVLVENIEKLVALRNRLDSAVPQIRLSFCKTYVNASEEKAFFEKWENIVDQIDVQNYISLTGEFQDLSSGKRAEASFCSDPFRRVAILVNGDVQCCCTFGNEDIIIGNIHEETIRDIWNGEKLRAIKDAFLENLDNIPGHCKECLTQRWIFE